MNDAAQPHPAADAPAGPRRWIFALELAYAALLLGGMVALASWHEWRRFVADPIGLVPLAVPWFGAIGGVTVSLRGIYDHRGDWDSAYNPRHIGRPLTAAISGLVAYLILITGVIAVGQTPSMQQADGRAQVVYDVVAFAIGYREEVFRTLLGALVDKFWRFLRVINPVMATIRWSDEA